jgi:hypothetical protein
MVQSILKNLILAAFWERRESDTKFVVSAVADVTKTRGGGEDIGQRTASTLESRESMGH